MKKFVPFLIPLLLIVIIRTLFLSTQALIQNNQEVSILKKELKNQQKENQFLSERLKLVKTSDFIEHEARTKLGLVRSGEEIVIAAPPPQKSSKIDSEEKENWEKWFNLFF